MYPVNFLLADDINNRQNGMQCIRDLWRKKLRTDILGLNWVILKSLHNHGLA